MTKIKLVIFDLDGTLADAYEAISKSVNFTLQKLGRPKASYLKIRKAVGWGDRRLLAAFVPEKDIDAALSIYRRHHRISLKKYSRLLPYSKGVLEYLRGNKIKAAIASNRPTEFTKILLNSIGIKGYFDYVLCADKLAEGKPNPEILLKITRELKINPQDALYVGDMVIDVETGHNAGVKAIAVLGGSSTLAEIKKARPFKIIKSLASLRKHL